jgi:hypothetical protein
MRQTRLVFFAIMGIAVTVIFMGRLVGIDPFTSRLVSATPAAVYPRPTQSLERGSASLPDIRAIPSETPLVAEVRDVFPIHTSIGSVYFIGEIVNTGTLPIAKPETIISLLDASGKRLAFQTGYTIHDVIQPGQTVPVAVLFTDPPSIWQGFEVFLQAKPATGREFMGYTDFRVESDALTKEEQGYYVISGEMKNTGIAKAEFIQAVVALYGQDKKLVGMGSSYVEEGKLDPSASSSFSVRVINVLAPPASYRIQFVGHAKPAATS